MKSKTPTQRRWLTYLAVSPLVLLICLIGSYALAWGFVARNGGFGAGDLSALFYSTIPYAVMLWLSSLVVLALLTRVPFYLAVILGLVIGSASGFFWTLFNRWMLGPWFGAWSFPVLYCWMFGGALSLMVAVIVQAAFLKPGATEHALGTDSP